MAGRKAGHELQRRIWWMYTNKKDELHTLEEMLSEYEAMAPADMTNATVTAVAYLFDMLKEESGPIVEPMREDIAAINKQLLGLLDKGIAAQEILTQADQGLMHAAQAAQQQRREQQESKTLAEQFAAASARGVPDDVAGAAFVAGAAATGTAAGGSTELIKVWDRAENPSPMARKLLGTPREPEPQPETESEGEDELTEEDDLKLLELSEFFSQGLMGMAMKHALGTVVRDWLTDDVLKDAAEAASKAAREICEKGGDVPIDEGQLDFDHFDNDMCGLFFEGMLGSGIILAGGSQAGFSADAVVAAVAAAYKVIEAAEAADDEAADASTDEDDEDEEDEETAAEPELAKPEPEPETAAEPEDESATEPETAAEELAVVDPDDPFAAMEAMLACGWW